MLSIWRLSVLGWAFALCLGVAAVPAGAAGDGPAPADPHAADEATIRKQAEDYAAAYARGDVAALSDMWAEDATLSDADGHVYRGRAAIRQQMEEFFKRGGKRKLAITVDFITFPSADTAVEHGSTRAAGSSARYTALHVKRDGRWRMVDVSENDAGPAGADSLKELSWLVGDWSVAGAADSLHVKSDWTADGRAIRSSYESVDKEGKRTLESQFIYWNPRTRRIESSQHDGQGGIGSAWWERLPGGEGDAASGTWIAHARSQEAGGATARADYRIHRLDNDRYTWRSTGRRLDGRTLPDTALIEVGRDKR